MLMPLTTCHSQSTCESISHMIPSCLFSWTPATSQRRRRKSLHVFLLSMQMRPSIGCRYKSVFRTLHPRSIIGTCNGFEKIHFPRDSRDPICRWWGSCFCALWLLIIYVTKRKRVTAEGRWPLNDETGEGGSCLRDSWSIPFIVWGYGNYEERLI